MPATEIRGLRFANPPYESGGCGRRFTSIWHIAGSAALGWTAMCPTIRPSRRTVTHGRFRESDLLRRLFETVLQRCILAGRVCRARR
jgi:hypothetical protein